MGETNIATQDKPLAQPGQSSVGKDGSTSNQDTEAYTKEVHQKLLSDALAEQGRKHQKEMETVVKERDTLKTQTTEKEKAISDISAEREELKSQIADLTQDDPEKFKKIQKYNELSERERRLKDEKDVLEADKQSHAEAVQVAHDTLREIAIWEMSALYQGGDPVKLKNLCDVAGAKTEEQITKIADTLWTKVTLEKKDEMASSPLKLYSGMNQGGTGFSYDPNNPSATIAEGLKQKTKK